MKTFAIFAAIGVFTFASASAKADCRALSLENVAGCAVAGSAAVKADREAVHAAEGRRIAAEPWVPSSPVLSLSASQRHITGNDAINYNASLSQELEISGTRASRRRAAEADVAAKNHDVASSERKLAAHALTLWFDAAAARDAVVLAKRIEQSGASVAKAGRARADSGVGSELDAEVAAAASLRLTQARIEAERLAATSRTQLATLVGSSDITIEGAMEPLKAPAKVETPPEVRALEEEKRAFEERAASYRRARFPMLTLSIFAQNDGFNERVLGAGLSLPIPLPSPLGRTYQGEAEESAALARQATARAENVGRVVNGERQAAKIALESAQSTAQLYTEERIGKAERLLEDVAQEIEKGRLPMRDALFAQQELIKLLEGRLEAKRTLGVASVDLALASGAPLEKK